MPFHIETERLVIHPLSKSDEAGVYKLQSDTEVARFIGRGVPKTKEESQELFEALLAHQKMHGFSLGPTYEKRSRELIGFAGLVHLGLDNSCPDIEIGYWLLPAFWGKGYATEIAEACVSWAFEHLPIDKLVAVTHPNNKRSQHVLQKAGLGLVGEAIYRGRDVLRFELNKP